MSNNRSNDHGVEETCAIMSSALNFYFWCILLWSKKIYIRRNINLKKGEVCMWNQYYYCFDLPKIRVGRAHTTKN